MVNVNIKDKQIYVNLFFKKVNIKCHIKCAIFFFSVKKNTLQKKEQKKRREISKYEQKY